MPASITALLDARLASDPSTPLITYYDDGTGERTELSGTTLANWVAKTANLLQDGLDLEAGQTVAVALPPHWQTAAVLLGAWSIGAVVTETVPADVLVTEEQRLDEFTGADTREVLGLSLHPMGGRLAHRPAHVTDYAAEVLLYGDDFAPYSPVDPDAAALRAGSLELTARSVVTAATELTARMGLLAGDRVLIDTDTAVEAGPLTWLLAPLSAGVSIVLCRYADPGKLAHRAETERVTATLGATVAGVRQIGAG